MARRMMRFVFGTERGRLSRDGQTDEEQNDEGPARARPQALGSGQFTLLRCKHTDNPYVPNEAQVTKKDGCGAGSAPVAMRHTRPGAGARIGPIRPGSGLRRA